VRFGGQSRKARQSTMAIQRSEEEIERLCSELQTSTYNYGTAKGSNIMEAIITNPDQLNAAKRLLHDVMNDLGKNAYEAVHFYLIEHPELPIK
jgi:hypothetical protein